MHAVLYDFPFPHVVCDVSGAPTAYRLGAGSPTDLLRFGFFDERENRAEPLCGARTCLR
jgi:hypothetical protein